ncbi:zinc finger MYND domain-containing protein [Phanerochaete sordida]|uniref:Zinc finger MYND domain-containing protein n=1 Tax=Phanerochaete sordida TaxID=48140 RepID=A0A9P3GE98_9APHY|nr:zinc finger MYND domain-containing protein [Phanerochaete sordida]
MLEHWFELFPDADSILALRGLPGDEMEERIRQLPTSWTCLLHEICTADTQCPAEEGTIFTLFRVLGRVVELAPEDAWCAAWNARFLPVLAELMDADFVFGYSQWALVSKGHLKTERITCILQLFLTCAKRVVTDARAPEVTALLDILQGTILGVFGKLWDIRANFLTGEYLHDPNVLYDNSSDPYIMMDELYDILNTLGYFIAETLMKHRTINLLETRLPAVFLVIWIYAEDAPIRFQGLANMRHVVLAADVNFDPWPPFLTESATGCTCDAIITMTMVRDFADENLVDAHLRDLVQFLSVWRDVCGSNATVLSSLEPRLSPSCLAAARRQLCRGNASDTAGFIFIATTICDNLSQGFQISGTQCYAFLDLFCHYITLCMQRNNARPPENLIKYVQWYGSQLADQRDRLADDSRPKSLVLRRHALQSWASVADELRMRDLPRRDPAWYPFAELWMSIKRLLPSLAREPPYVPFAVLERCAWDQCLCSRHKPAHRMRICKGCERVVYCGKRCQKSDWESGGHRERCRRVGQ